VRSVGVATACVRGGREGATFGSALPSMGTTEVGLCRISSSDWNTVPEMVVTARERAVGGTVGRRVRRAIT
jgi:hypothetical protein